jgi:hypothetical protein
MIGACAVPDGKVKRLLRIVRRNHRKFRWTRENRPGAALSECNSAALEDGRYLLAHFHYHPSIGAA